jgi:hypothetical protein
MTTEPLWTTNSRVVSMPPGSRTRSRRTSKTLPWKSSSLEMILARGVMCLSGEHDREESGDWLVATGEKMQIIGDEACARIGRGIEHCVYWA